MDDFVTAWQVHIYGTRCWSATARKQQFNPINFTVTWQLSGGRHTVQKKQVQTVCNLRHRTVLHSHTLHSPRRWPHKWSSPHSTSSWIAQWGRQGRKCYKERWRRQADSLKTTGSVWWYWWIAKLVTKACTNLAKSVELIIRNLRNIVWQYLCNI